MSGNHRQDRRTCPDRLSGLIYPFYRVSKKKVFKAHFEGLSCLKSNSRKQKKTDPNKNQILLAEKGSDENICSTCYMFYPPASASILHHACPDCLHCSFSETQTRTKRSVARGPVTAESRVPSIAEIDQV